MKTKNKHSTIYFDGICLLCNRFVAFILKYDRRDRYRFSTIQHLDEIEAENPREKERKDTILFHDNGRWFDESEAVLRIVIGLGGGWKVIGITRVLPLFVRNAIYRWIARKRYGIFGSTDYCSVVNPDVKHKFL